MATQNEGAVAKIDFRIGINVGDIIIDGDDILGDGVNVAARVENEGKPEGVRASQNRAGCPANDPKQPVEQDP
jgi:class 3 adenylate cyclase